jgi:serine/threonine protein kinase
VSWLELKELIMISSHIRLDVIKELISDYLSREKVILTSSRDFLEKLMNIAAGNKLPEVQSKKELDHIIISCHSEIQKDKTATSTIIQIPNKENLILSQLIESKTQVEADYSAIYTGLNALTYKPKELYLTPNMYIEVRMSNETINDQINNYHICSNEQEQKARDTLLDLIKLLIIGVGVRWFPENSTEEMVLAYQECQRLLK